MQYLASGEVLQIGFFYHITEQAFLSFYRMTNIAKLFSALFSELELPNGKANGRQVEAMQTV